MALLDMSLSAARDLMKCVALAISPEIVPAAKAVESRCKRKVSFGCPIIDRTLGGGLPVSSGLCEVSGEGGVGKTQLALQMLLSAVLSEGHGGLGGRSLAISCGEGPFPVRRLEQLAESVLVGRGIGCDTTTLLSRIGIHTVNSTAEQVAFVSTHLPRLMLTEGIRLVVMDSISSLFRADVGSLLNRSSMLVGMARTMKRLSDQYDCVFLIVNQISRDAPALGLLWSNCVNTRLFLRRVIGEDYRELGVEFCPYMPEKYIPVSITREGLKGHDVPNAHSV